MTLNNFNKHSKLRENQAPEHTAAQVTSLLPPIEQRECWWKVTYKGLTYNEKLRAFKIPTLEGRLDLNLQYNKWQIDGKVWKKARIKETLS